MPERGTRRRDPIEGLDLAIDIEDLQLDRQQKKMLEAQSRLIRHEHDETRSVLLQAVSQLRSDFMADLSGVREALTGLSTEITKLADQVAALQAGTVTQDEIDEIAGDIRDAAGRVDAALEVEGEDEPPVEPEPPVI